MSSYLIESLDSLSLITERKKIITNNNFTEASINIYYLDLTTIDF